MKSKILDLELQFKAVHVGLMLDENLWQHDVWAVVIEGQMFEFKTGIGHRKPLPHAKIKGTEAYYKYKKLMSGNLKKTKENLLTANEELKKVSKPNNLNIDDVLYSLIMDAEALELTFSEWCDNLGYDNDSIKAMSIYTACQENAKKLKTFLPDIEKARELFSDY